METQKNKDAARASPKQRYSLLGSFEYQVLAAVDNLELESAYGSAIRKYITEKTGREIAIGAVYVTLDRLGRKGFVSAETVEAKPVRGGRSKRVFRLEGSGVRALQQTTAANNAVILGQAKEPSDGKSPFGPKGELSPSFS